MWPQAECQQSLEDEIGKKQIVLLSLEGAEPCWHLYSTQWAWSTSGLQECERIHFCCFKSLSWWHFLIVTFRSFQFSSVAQSCLTLCNPMNCSTPDLPVHHQLPEFTQTHIHWVDDAIQPSHSLSPPSPPAPNPSQHQSLFQWVNSSHEVAKVLELQLQHQSFQWTPRTDLL